jgi:hypothetical protein
MFSFSVYLSIPDILDPSNYNLYFHSVSIFVILFVTKAKKTATDFTRACLAVRSSHSYFQDALRICDSVRGLSIGGLGGSIGDMGKMIEYRGARFF